MKLLAPISGAVAGLMLLFYVGCSTSQTSNTYKASVAGDQAVRLAMTGWGVYVGQKHPGTNTELQVFNAFQAVKAGEILVLNATASLASNPTNTAPLAAAENALAATQSSFISLISSITNAVK